MNPTSRVKIEVCGARYNITSNEPEEYVKELGAQLNAQVGDMLSQNSTLSVTDALVLCLLNYMDNYRKAEENTDRMRDQLTGYLEDAAKYRIEADEAKREIEKLKGQLNEARQKQKQLKAQLDEARSQPDEAKAAQEQ